MAPGQSLWKAWKFFKIFSCRDAESSQATPSSQPVNLPSAQPLMKPLIIININDLYFFCLSMAQIFRYCKLCILSIWNHHSYSLSLYCNWNKELCRATESIFINFIYCSVTSFCFCFLDFLPFLLAFSASCAAAISLLKPLMWSACNAKEISL